MVWAHFEQQSDHTTFRFDIRVSKWPNPNTNRTKNAFRMQVGEGMPFPRPQRYKLWMDNVPESPNNRLYPIIDLDQAGEFELFGSSGEDISGREVEMSIIQHLEDDFPGSHGSGIEYAFKFKQTGFDDYHEQWFFENDHFGDNFRENPMMESSLASPLTLHHVHDIPSELNLTWPTNDFVPMFNWEPMSECYIFHPGDLQGIWANFNGVDSYISLDHNIPPYQGPWFFEADIRSRTNLLNPMLCPSGQLSVIGTFEEDALWGSRRLDLPDLPGFNVWFKFREEFEWSSGLQLNHRAWIDDVLQDEKTISRLNLGYDNIGVRSLAGTPVWGDFDMKNLLYKRGTFASPVVKLDMPLTQNALDLGPDENHGTTHEMDLPSS